MSKTFRRPPIKQHKDFLEDNQYSHRVEKNKKKEKKNKHPLRIIQEEIGGMDTSYYKTNLDID